MKSEYSSYLIEMYFPNNKIWKKTFKWRNLFVSIKWPYRL